MLSTRDDPPSDAVTTQVPIKQILEAALLAVGAAPLSLESMQDMFTASTTTATVNHKLIKAALTELAQDCAGRGVELCEVASGWRLQVRQDYAPWISKLFAERPARYSRALLEILAIIAYRQPLTRGDIEAIRGVEVNSAIIKTLMERDWIKIAGYKEGPGRPALLATTQQFLDYFGLKSLTALPPLQKITDDPRVAALWEAFPGGQTITNDHHSTHTNVAGMDAVNYRDVSVDATQPSGEQHSNGGHPHTPQHSSGEHPHTPQHSSGGHPHTPQHSSGGHPHPPRSSKSKVSGANLDTGQIDLILQNIHTDNPTTN